MTRPDARRAVLRRLDSEEARARSILALQGGWIPLDDKGQWSASVAPMRPASDATDSQIATGWTVRVEWCGARFELVLPREGLRSLVESQMPGTQLDDLPEELALAALERAWPAVAAGLAGAAGEPARLVEIREGAQASALPHGLVAQIRAPAPAAGFEVRIHTDSKGLQFAAAAAARRPGKRASTDIDIDRGLVKLPLSIGRTHLRAADVSSLRLNDVLLIDHAFLQRRGDAAPRLWVKQGASHGFSVALHADKLEVIEPWKPLDMNITDNEPDGTDAHSIDELRVVVDFDIGELSLPVRVLRSLAVGQVFDLNRALPDGVRVRANGQTIAEGELVEIDGRLGVALTRLGLREQEQP